MDANEFALIRALMQNNDDMRVIAVGDDDQNIYEFRGSDSAHMQSLIDEYGATRYELVENYRSKANIVPPQRESIKDYRRITCEKGKYLAKQPQILRNEPTSSQKTMNQTVKTMHRIALVFAMESCMKNA